MDRLSKQSKDVQKSSKVEETKKCETFAQRAKRYLPFATVTGLLAAAGMVEATHADATGPADHMQHPYNSLPERYVPSDKDIKQHKEFLEKMNLPSWHFGPKDAQATSSGETSQSSMETLLHQRDQNKNKGKKQLSSNEKDIANLRALMERAKDDPEARQRVRQMLEHRQLAQVPCLSVDNTRIISNVVDAPDFPGREMRTLEYLRVKNNCPTNSYRTGFGIDHDVTCPPGTVLHTADDFSASAGLLANPANLLQGQEAVGANEPDQHRYQCRTNTRAYAPLTIVERVTGDGYSNPANRDALGDLSSPQLTKVLLGELP